MKFLEKLMMNVLNKIVDWFKEYDDEITWFLIGSLSADGINQISKNIPYGLLLLFISGVLWFIYMKELKENK
jgi:hypothetical protein